MPDLTGLQFESFRRGHTYQGMAFNRSGDPVASANITVPSEHISTRWDFGGLTTFIPAGIRTAGWTPISNPTSRPPKWASRPASLSRPYHAKVSWASANEEGVAKAAPHQLLAAMSQRHGVVPLADQTLSPEGARMSRSAARRGLIKPHPDNPKMEANISTIYDSPEGLQEALDYSHEEFNYHGEGRSQKFSSTEMAQARHRVFPPREKPKPHINQEQMSF